MTEIKLPPLPEPTYRSPSGAGNYFDGYTKQSLESYATAAIEPYAKRIAKLEAALQSQNREDAELLKIGRAIYRACEDLPIGCEVRIELENGAATVRAIEQDGDAVMIDGAGDPLSGQIHQAIDHARRIEGGS